MIQALITAEQIIALAFEDKNFSPAYIADDIIIEVQQGNIRDSIGKKYYEELLSQTTANTVTTANKEIIENYLKKSIAWFVKAKIAPGHAAKMVNAGIVSNTVEYGNVASSTNIQNLISASLSSANFWLTDAMKYMEDDANKINYPTYNNNKSCDTGSGRTNPIRSWVNL